MRTLRKQYWAGAGAGLAILAAAVIVPIRLERAGHDALSRCRTAAAPAPACSNETAARRFPQPAAGAPHYCISKSVYMPVSARNEEMPWVCESNGVTSWGAETGRVNQVFLPDLGEKLRAAVLSGQASTVSILRAEFLVLGEQAVPILADLTTNGDFRVEVEALRLLTSVNTETALTAVLCRVMDLDRKDPHFCDYQGVFSSCRDPRVADALVSFLGHTESDEVRLYVLELLKDLKGEFLATRLECALKQPVDALHAADCAGLLTQAHDPSCVDGLETALCRNTSPELLRAAAAGLANAGTPEACDFLISGSAAGDVESTYCLESLPQITSPHAQEMLLGALWNPNLPAPVRQAAAAALSHQAAPRVVTALKNAAAGEPNPKVRAEIAKTLDVLSATMNNNAAGGGVAVDPDNELWF